MKLWHRVFGLRNGVEELEPLKRQFSDSSQRVQENARRLARAAENVSKQRQHDDMQALICRFRINEGHD